MYVHLQRQRDPSMRAHTEVTVQGTLTPHRASSLTMLFPASVRKTADGQDNNAIKTEGGSLCRTDFGIWH
jgi:hypothetical protein